MTLIPYDELKDQSRHNIEGTDQWQEEVLFGSEKVIGDGNRKRVATIKIYKAGESLPRFQFQAPFSSAGSGGVPVGTVIAWPLFFDRIKVSGWNVTGNRWMRATFQNLRRS